MAPYITGSREFVSSNHTAKRYCKQVMLFFCLFSPVFVLFHCAFGGLLPTEDVISVSTCLRLAADKYFVERPIVSVFTSGLHSEVVLTEIYKSESHAKKLRNFTTFHMDFTEDYRSYAVIVVESLKDFISNKNLVYKLCLWNARARYIFVTLQDSRKFLKNFLAVVWEYYIINAIVFIPKTSENYEVYAWFPYHEGFCGDGFKMKLIDECDKGEFVRKVDLFPNKIPLDLHGCPVTVRVLIWPPFIFAPKNTVIEDDVFINVTEGVEVMLIKAIAHVANFSVRFTASTVPHDWGLATRDGNATGSIKALMEKKADIGIGAFGPTEERRMYCDYSACHLQESISWCVPKAQEMPKWKHLLLTFEFTAWLAMIFTYIFVSLLTWLLCRCPPKDASNFVVVKNSFVYLFSLFLGMSAKETPGKFSGRICFFIWVIFGLHFVVAYQAKLMGVLLKPQYEKQLSTMEEVLASDLEFQLLPTHKRFYANTDDWLIAKVVREWVNCYDSDACMERIALQRDFALCTIKSHAEFEALKYLDENGNSLIYCINYLLYSSEMYMTKGFPFRDRINKLIYRARNSGLILKWHTDIDKIWRVKYMEHMSKNVNSEQVLTVQHMQGAFAILIIGLLIATVAFISELIYKKCFDMNIKKKL